MMPKVSESFTRAGDQTEMLLRELQINLFNGGADSEVRFEALRAAAAFVSYCRTQAELHAKSEASNNIIDLARFRIPMPEGLQW
jgi:hypothetical protein